MNAPSSPSSGKPPVDLPDTDTAVGADTGSDTGSDTGPDTKLLTGTGLGGAKRGTGKGGAGKGGGGGLAARGGRKTAGGARQKGGTGQKGGAAQKGGAGRQKSDKTGTSLVRNVQKTNVPAKVQPTVPAKLELKPEPAPKPVPPPVPMARPRKRHWLTVLSFLLMVAAPVGVTGWYLWERAVDQYASYVGFSVRKEEASSSLEALVGIPGLSGSSSEDTDILYEYLQGQELVATLDDDLDLRAIWSKADPDIDPVFSYHPPGTIEDMVAYWGRMVKIYYDSGTGLIDLRVLAFDAADSTLIATAIYDRASGRINELSAVAREDAIGYARDELTQAEDRLRKARVDIQTWRNKNGMIDPTIQTQSQSGLIGALETQLAEAQIDLQLLLATARDTDPRITQAELKIGVIQRQIASERSELGLESGADTGLSVADLVGQYEILAADLEFAQLAYTASLATYDAARNEARRQSRYLAAHVKPTSAERAQYPDRVMIMGLITLFLFLFWSVVVLVAYALRDRR